MKLRFLGAAQTVTGSKTLCTHRNRRFLVDCGLFQGAKPKRLLNWQPFQEAEKIDFVVLTHAHIDHSGYLPKLVKEGFKGPIYCSPGTRDLCEVLLLDSAKLQEEDASFANRTGHSHHRPALPLYTTRDAENALRLIQTVKQNDWVDLKDGLSLKLTRSGHIIGSSFVQLGLQGDYRSQLVTFSGDLGNGRSEIIKPPVSIPETDFLVLEGTYGDRLQPRGNVRDALRPLIHQIFERKGVMVIPAFSVGRTQEILYHLRVLEESRQIPTIPVYLDSPMANHATQIFLDHPEEHLLRFNNGELHSPICPSCYSAVKSADESMVLCMKDGPMIVISAAGMLTGGRILHHLKHRLPDRNNMVVFVGYQAEETKGALLQQGIPTIRIHHEEVAVDAEIKTIEALSAHADYQDILDWLKGLKQPPTKIFLNHGEPAALETLAQKIKATYNFNVMIPKPNEEIDLARIKSELNGRTA
ncbi:MAG: MBL fold metallo-hydrolase [Oligoflexia bacterium]|nr:MBL fold metallo-hydrolase [Oligoflexia bacterium]